MERVAFLIEESNTTIRCLLNPESLVIRRLAGVAERRSMTGRLTGTSLLDDPLMYTGGGRTELELHLLFDTSLVDAGARPGDVRELTLPLWDLTENRGGTDRYGAPSLVRFLWGKAWNVPGVVTSIAERLEQFEPSGAPQRSWLRMRLIRVTDPLTAPGQEPAQSDGHPVASTPVLNGTSPGTPIEEHGGSGFDEFDLPSIDDIPEFDVWTGDDQSAGDADSDSTDQDVSDDSERTEP